MLELCGFSLRGYEGCLVTVETDLRRGLPGAEIIGLPDSAVKEAKERVRAAIKNSQFNFPTERLLINMTPAGIKKEGAAFDLAIALAVLHVTRQISVPEEIPDIKIMVLGELELSGRVRAVPGVLSALAGGQRSGGFGLYYSRRKRPRGASRSPRDVLARFIFKTSRRKFATMSVGNVAHLYSIACVCGPTSHFDVDLKDIKGQPFMKRALEVAAAGRHHLFFLGHLDAEKPYAAAR